MRQRRARGLADDVAGQGHDGGPYDRAQLVPEQEAPPLHARHTHHPPRGDSDAGDEAPQKHGGAAVASEESFRLR